MATVEASVVTSKGKEKSGNDSKGKCNMTSFNF